MFRALALLLIAALGLVQPSTAQPQAFLLASAPLFSAPDGAALGKLLVASPVTVLDRQEGWRRVRLSGWTQAGGERAVYAAPGLRVLLAALRREAVPELVFGEVARDAETGLDWRQSTITGWVRGDRLTPGIAPLWERAQTLFATRCTACHVRRIPGKYSANQWTSHLKVMGPRTGLPKEDQWLIRVFLQVHSADRDTLLPLWTATGEGSG